MLPVFGWLCEGPTGSRYEFWTGIKVGVGCYFRIGAACQIGSEVMHSPTQVART
jgi:hypothetical protein